MTPTKSDDDSNLNEEYQQSYKKKHRKKSKRSRVNENENSIIKKIKRISPRHSEEEEQNKLECPNLKKRKREEIEDFAINLSKNGSFQITDRSSSDITESDNSIQNNVSGDCPIAISTLESNDILEEIEMELDEDLPDYYPAIDGCRSVDEFQFLNRVEEGTYGVVYRAKDKRTKEIVALKRLKMENEREGFPMTSIREINTLLKGQHENIVTLKEVVMSKNMETIFIVMDFIEHDLKSLIEIMKHRKQTFTIGEVKCLLKQLLTAVAHLHDNWILHRDLKTSNLLLSHKGILKVGDFGLAREYGSPVKPYTPIVVTLWYRAPELLLGVKEYSTAIDIWSVGCIFAELLLMKPVFPGKSEIDQVNNIFKFLGTPNEAIWPGFNQLPACQIMKFTRYPISNLRSRFYVLGEIGLSLIQKFFIYDPVKRIVAEDALSHSYFNECPLPIDPSMFPTWPAKSEVGHKRAFACPKSPNGGEFNKSADSENVRVPMGGGFCLRF